MIEPYYENNLVKLYHGDCLDIMPQLTERFDACITDPPYGITTDCLWDAVIPFDDMWNCLKNIMNNKAAICLFGSEPFSSSLRLSNIKMFKYDWIWIKTKAGNFASCRKNPMKMHEIISVFYKEFPKYNLFNLKKIKPVDNSRKNKGSNLGHCHCINNKYMQTETGFHKSILYYSNKSGNGYSLHPTQKPVSLIEYLIKTYTDENDIVLDFCAGSGTTGVACMNTNRRCVLIEKEQKYCDIIANRLESNKDLFNMIEE